MLIPINQTRIDYRKIKQVVDLLRSGKIVVYPTDTIYGLGCDALQPKTIKKINILKGRDSQPLSIICSDLKNISQYAVVSNLAYRILNKYLPGAFTFILTATKAVPRLLQDPKRKTIGIRVPDNKICLSLVKELGNPIVTTSVNKHGEEAETDPEVIEKNWNHPVAAVINAGIINSEASTIVSLVDDEVKIIRQGKGDFSW